MVEIQIPGLREWDLILLKRYNPVCHSPPRVCSMCGLGPCELSPGRGKCGMTQAAQAARWNLFMVLQGASAHMWTARKLLQRAIGKLGKDYRIELGDQIEINAPITSITSDIQPNLLSDLEDVLSWIEGELVRLFSCLNFGGESDPNELRSRSLHAGMLDLTAIEIADISQILLYCLPRGDPDTPLVRFGVQDINPENPRILLIGHDASVGIGITEFIQDKDLEVCGLCCMAHDVVRHTSRIKVVGNLSSQLEFISKGFADVVVIDEQCIRADLLFHLSKTGSAVIATSYNCAYGLPDLTHEPEEVILQRIVSGQILGGLILDLPKAAKVAVRLAPKIRQRRGLKCMFLPEGSAWLRVGRGPIRDTEIKDVAPGIIQGQIPGIIVFAGCPGSEEDRKEVAWMAEELIKLGYIVLSFGCSAMDLAYTDIFRRYGSNFDRGNLANLGSCVSASHAIGSAIKIAAILSHRRLKGNFVEIADYILNRVGICIVGWGAHTPKALAIFTGSNRLGIPVVLGKRGYGYGHQLLKGTSLGFVFDKRWRQMCWVGYLPEKLLCVSGSAKEALLEVIRLCMRPNDTPSGRKVKLRNYITASERLYGRPPQNVGLLVRSNYDIPEEYRDLVKEFQPSWVPDPTLLAHNLIMQG
jgi:CO dehydrogenase/acetyl-CoA synthase alpha subunit